MGAGAQRSLPFCIGGAMTLHQVGLLALVVAGAPIVWRTARGMLHGHFAPGALECCESARS